MNLQRLKELAHEIGLEFRPYENLWQLQADTPCPARQGSDDFDDILIGRCRRLIEKAGYGWTDGDSSDNSDGNATLELYHRDENHKPFGAYFPGTIVKRWVGAVIWALKQEKKNMTVEEATLLSAEITALRASIVKYKQGKELETATLTARIGELEVTLGDIRCELWGHRSKWRRFAGMPDIQNNSQAVGAFLLCADEVDALLRGSPRVPVVVPKPGEESEKQ